MAKKKVKFEQMYCHMASHMIPRTEQGVRRSAARSLPSLDLLADVLRGSAQRLQRLRFWIVRGIIPEPEIPEDRPDEADHPQRDETGPPSESTDQPRQEDGRAAAPKREPEKLIPWAMPRSESGSQE